MSNKKITDLTELTTPTTDDVFPVVDIATNTTRKVQLGNLPTTSVVSSAIASKQDTLVSGTNIKTLNNTSLLGSGNINVVASPSGVAGAIQFSDGSAFASDASNLFWDDTNNRLGVGTNAPTQTLDVRNTGTGAIFNVQNNIGYFSFGFDSAGGYGQAGTAGKGVAFYNNAGTSFLSISGSGGTGVNILNPSAALHIKGSGSTFATTSFLVQNSSASELLKIRDDGQIICGGGVQAVGVIGTAYGLFGSQSYDASVVLGAQSTSAGFLPPRMTTTQRDAIATPATGLKVYNTTTNTTDTYDGTTWQRFGQQTFIKGSGTTSATSSLIVANSAGTTALTVKDDLSTSVKILYIDNTIEGATSGRMNIISQYDLAIRPNTGGVGFAEGFGFNVNVSALIEMQSTTKGFLPPRMTTTQKNAIATPASGLVVYDSTTNKLCCYNGSTWNDLF